MQSKILLDLLLFFFFARPVNRHSDNHRSIVLINIIAKIPNYNTYNTDKSL